MREIALPLGISFYTFQAMSYVIDLYRGQHQCCKRIGFCWRCTFSFFPQLVAGPIVRYSEVETQLRAAPPTWPGSATASSVFCTASPKK